MEWTEEAIGQLRILWAEGHSTAEIGRRMGISKNAVVGKAHRLGLVARPSPIRRDAAGESVARLPSPRRVSGPTLPPLQAASPAPVSPPLPAVAPPPPVPEAPRPVAAPVLRAVPARAPRRSACCWPIGEPGTPSFRFCEADAQAGKPYCAEHAQLAYVKVRDRREEAA